MSTSLFQVIALLESKGLKFTIERQSNYAVTIYTALVGKRIEINVGEDGIVDVAVFVGDEQVQVGMEAVEKALEED